MTTLNISLPDQLKADGQKLIKEGHFASFSDLVRTALRSELQKSRYELWANQAHADHQNGKSITLKNESQIKDFVDKL